MINKPVNSSNIDKIFNQLKKRYCYYNNTVISCCFNKSKILCYGISKSDNHIHSIKNNKQFSIHAEIDALNNYYSKYKKNIRKKNDKINILTIRIINNIAVNAKPCQFCVKSFQKTYNINKIYYSDDNFIYCDTFKNLYKNINNLKYSSGDRRVYKNINYNN